MNVLMMTDLEGVAGVTSFETQTYNTGRFYDNACRLLTAEVNAAVDGALEAGAKDVMVIDGHGVGGIWFEDLHPAARVLHGRPLAPRHRFQHIFEQCDVGLIIGQHAMAGLAVADLNHTQSSRQIDYIKLNGQLIGEIAQFALYLGTFGKPMVYLSGDDTACREAEQLMPGLVTTAVKESIGRNSAISISAVESRRRIRRDIALALKQHAKQPRQPLHWPGPYVLEKRYFHTDVADAVEAAGQFERIDGQTVRKTSDDLRSLIFA